MININETSRFKALRILFLFLYSILFILLATVLTFVVLKWENNRPVNLLVFLIFGYITLFIFSSIIIIFQLYLPLLRIRRIVDEVNIKKSDYKQIFKKIQRISPLAEEIANIVTFFLETIEKEYSESMIYKQSEFLALQSQINPHFLYNTLDSIRGQVISEGLVETGEMVETLSLLFRYNISHGERLISFEQELENIDNYMKIMRYRFEDRFQMIKYIPEDSIILGHEIPKLTLQPIVENAIMHGLEQKRSKGTIVIRANATDSRILITVEDDGIGMDRTVLDSLNARLSKGDKAPPSTGTSTNSGIALLNVNERIKLLYGSNYGIHANSVKGLGTEIHISLPLQGLNDS